MKDKDALAKCVARVRRRQLLNKVLYYAVIAVASIVIVVGLRMQVWLIMQAGGLL